MALHGLKHAVRCAFCVKSCFFLSPRSISQNIELPHPLMSRYLETNHHQSIRGDPNLLINDFFQFAAGFLQGGPSRHIAIYYFFTQMWNVAHDSMPSTLVLRMQVEYIGFVTVLLQLASSFTGLLCAVGNRTTCQTKPIKFSIRTSFVCSFALVCILGRALCVSFQNCDSDCSKSPLLTPSTSFLIKLTWKQGPSSKL